MIKKDENDKDKTSVKQFKNQFKINAKLSAINIIEFHSKMTDVKILVIRKTVIINIQRKNEVKLA